MKQFEIIISNEYAGVKPKNFLKKSLDVNYNQLIKAIKNKRISLNGKKIKEDSILQEGDVIAIWDSSIKQRNESSKSSITNSDIEAKDLGMKTLFAHDDFLVLDKKAGVVVQGAYDNSESLSKHLRYLESTNSSYEKLHHVHRLDKDTTGCLLIGNKTQNIRELNSLFQKGNITKIYTAICCGSFQKKEDEITLNLARNEEGKLPKVIVSNNGKETKLIYKVIDEITINDEILSVVEIQLITGFMHQIRVTMQYLNHPILGDTMYCNNRLNEKFSNEISRQLLHSSKIEFDWRGENIKVEAEMPKNFKQFLNM